MVVTRAETAKPTREPSGTETGRAGGGGRGARRRALRRLLRQAQAELGEKLQSLRTTLPAASATVKDPEEAGVEDVARDMEVALAEIESATARMIDDALRRLEESTYGACERCGEPIAEARLKVLPFARFCRRCQEAAEEAASPERPRRLFEEEPGAPAPEGPRRGPRW